MSWGRLEKLKIKSYLAGKREEAIFYFLNKTFTVLFNPESYSFRYENEYQRYQGINTAGRTAHYMLTRARTLSIKLIIDDSSATSGLASGTSSTSFVRMGRNFIKRKTTKSIHDQVEEFLDIAARMDGDIHAPRYLKLEWGDLIFDCRLQSVDVNYTLFNRSGTAIRAELDVVFLEDLNPEKLAKLTNKNSPDLTHSRTVLSGDTLSVMSHRIYRDSTYYIRVAQANKINHFRKLRPGTTLNFPPIK